MSPNQSFLDVGHQFVNLLGINMVIPCLGLDFLGILRAFQHGSDKDRSAIFFNWSLAHGKKETV